MSRWISRDVIRSPYIEPDAPPSFTPECSVRWTRLWSKRIRVAPERCAIQAAGCPRTRATILQLVVIRAGAATSRRGAGRATATGAAGPAARLSVVTLLAELAGV